MGLIRLNNQSLTNVTALPFDAGKVLKVSHVEIAASSSRDSATSYDDDLDFGSFTPSETTSTVLIYGVANFDSGSGKYCYYKWVIDGTDYLSTGVSADATHGFLSGTSFNNRLYMPSTIMTSVANTDGSAITVVCQGKVHDGGTLWINRSNNTGFAGSPSSVVFTEIEA